MNKLFSESLEEYGERPALIVPDGDPVTYFELAARADAFARRIGPERSLVFLEANTSVDSIAAYLGCLRSGHVVHLLDPARPHALDALMRFHRPGVLMRETDGRVRVDRLDGGTTELHPHLSLLLSTSGSTGSPRLVKLSRANLESNTQAICEYLDLTGHDRSATTLKFHYAYGLSVLNTHLAVGGALVLTDLSVRDPEFPNLLRTHRVTNLSGVPETYRILHRQPLDFSSLPDLRFMTQAGGRLAPELVRHFAGEGRRHGWSFFVMYGQTEASPRMAYLPPEMAGEYPDSIGVPIPGGAFELVDERGMPIESPGIEGELFYRGPNVMMGYARDAEDLVTDETPSVLATGDLAVWNQAGMPSITGRRSRLVKPFGIRVHLDDLETILDRSGIEACVTGNDQGIRIHVCGIASQNEVRRELATATGIPSTFFSIDTIRTLPRLSNGKLDRRSLETVRQAATPPKPDSGPILGFLREVGRELCSILLGRPGRWASVEEIYRIHFPHEEIDRADSFVSLGGDSILFVEMSLCLEDHLHDLPEDWHDRTIGELEAAHA